MTQARGPTLAIFFGLFILMADCVVKYLCQKYLPVMHGFFFPYGGIGIFKNFLGIDCAIVHTINKGAAWGLFSNFQIHLLVVRILFLIGIITYICFYNMNARLQIPLVMITAGALGNIVDYFLYGHVIDMFYFSFEFHQLAKARLEFAVFNIADSAICLGILWLIIISYIENANPSTNPRQNDAS